jgi:16S rRNA C967 or C1407 C5-methylase (RsmB/RsmF family)
MIDTFEAEYPYSVDQEIYCNELKKRNKRRINKGKNSKEFPINTNFLSKKKKMEFFTESELRDTYFDKLKNHLHLNMVKRLSKEHKGDLFIDLSLNSTKSDENENIEDSEKENMNSSDDKKNSDQFIVPILI